MNNEIFELDFLYDGGENILRLTLLDDGRLVDPSDGEEFTLFELVNSERCWIISSS